MKFLNLNTGYSFDALWNENQERGYIFWFPKEQSIGLTYTMPIAFITDTNNPITLTIENNDIFSFITLNNESVINIDGYSFDGKPEYLKSFITTPQEVNNKYVHVFNIACKSDDANEYICKINIGEEGYIRVGADFYGENEASYINLANMGVELPLTIQKAIYDSNVHEDITDNILINRKFKELLSNYWNIIANKGSYKSLLNSFEWFEWENNLNIKEIYKHTEADKTLFNDKDMVTSIENMIEEEFNNFVKTSYISLYCSLQNELPSYDNEYNPELSKAVFKWSINDIKLKIALFAKFLGIYFLPIHISILHATAEDKVFTNTIKTIHGSNIKRNDNFYDYEYIECNIKDNDVFKLGNVSTQVTHDTVFGLKYPDDNINYDTNIVFGVDEFPTGIEQTFNTNTDSLKTFAIQYYTGPGAIIPITLIIPNRHPKEFVKQTFIEYINDNNELIKLVFNNIFYTSNTYATDINKIPEISIDFNFLAKKARNYNIKFTFILSSSKTLTRTINFIVEDVDNLNINIYKVKAKNDLNGLTLDDFYDTTSSKYLFRIQSNDNLSELSKSYYMQYLPYLDPINYKNYNKYNGIKLNHTIILSINKYSNYVTEINDIVQYMSNIYGYLYFFKYDNNNITYITFISNTFIKEFYSKTENQVLSYLSNKCFELKNNIKIIREEAVFYPQFHYLEKIEGNTIEDYTIKPYEAICGAVEIENSNNEHEEFRYGHLIQESEWKFYNHLTNETITHPASSQNPFIAGNNNILRNGYYDISFKYKLGNEIKECKLDSAFRIKD